jgi:hypothetical protein
MRSAIRSSGTIAIVGMLFLAPASHQLRAEDRFGEPEIAQSGSPDDNLATSSGPGAHEAESEDLDSMVVGSERLDSHTVGSEDPMGMVVGAEDLDADEGHSRALQSLATAAAPGADRGTEGSSSEAPTNDAVAAAGRTSPPSPVQSEIGLIHRDKQALAEARERNARAEGAYSNMMARDYPRGEARLQIVAERQAAQRALKAANERYSADLNGGAPASR